MNQTMMMMQRWSNHLTYIHTYLPTYHTGHVAFSGAPEGEEADDFLYRRLGYHYHQQQQQEQEQPTSSSISSSPLKKGEGEESRRSRKMMMMRTAQNPADLMIQALFQSSPEVCSMSVCMYVCKVYHRHHLIFSLPFYLHTYIHT